MAKNRYGDAGLNQLTTAQLEELLRMDYASQEHNEAAVFRILEVLEQREKEHPSGRLPDVDTAWAEFQNKYNIPEGAGQSLYPLPPEAKQVETPPKKVPTSSSGPRPRPRLMIRRVVAAVAVLVVMVSGAAVAQASGLDIFGLSGIWNNDIFKFDVNPLDPTIRHALKSHNLPLELAPTWMPEGFVAGEPYIGENGLGHSVTVTYTNDEDNYCSFSIDYYTNSETIGNIGYQKDDTPIETYMSYGRKFFIFSNLGDVTSTWSDGEHYVVTVWGSISLDEIKEILNSIGG